MNKIHPFILVVVLCLTILGCSQDVGITPSIPEDAHQTALYAEHQLWGLYQFSCDPVAGTVDVIPLREGEMHINVISMVDNPPGVYLTLESTPVFNQDSLDVDIGLRHPYESAKYFTGFDVCGILISNGSVSMPSDPDLVYASKDEVRLINADGLTRWWDPVEFPYDPDAPLFCYNDGNLGTPDSQAHYSSTLNGYKYFADGLGADDSIDTIDPASRGVFSTGQKNIRRYLISMNGGITFNYAIDACWAAPDMSEPPIVVPDDFPPTANRPEAWRVDIHEVSNTLYFDATSGVSGGELDLSIDVYDHFNANQNSVTVESIAGFGPVTSSSPTGTGYGYSTYQIEIPGDNLTQAYWTEALISVACEVEGYGGKLPGEAVSAYFLYPVYINDKATTDYKLIFPNDPILLSDSSLSDVNYQFPRIIENGNGEIVAAWQMNPANYSDVKPVFRISGNNGIDWGPPVMPISSSGVFVQTKMALDSDDNAYEACLHYNVEGQPLEDPFLVRCPPGGPGFWGSYMGYGGHSLETIFTQDGYPLYFLDYNGNITVKKGEVQNSCNGKPDVSSWINLTSHDVAANGQSYLSYGASIVRGDDGVIHLTYLDDTDDNRVMAVTNEDGSGLNWSEPFQLASGGYGVITVYDPAMSLDTSGGLSFAFIREFSEVVGIRTLLYAYSPDGSPYSLSEYEAALGGYLAMEYPSVAGATLSTGIYPVVSCGTGSEMWNPTKVNCAWRSPITGLWSEALQINITTAPAYAPAMYIDSQNYVHIMWYEPNEHGDDQIMYRRGEFVPVG